MPRVRNSTVAVRSAQAGDVPWILDHLERFAEFYGTKHSLFPVNRAVATDIVERMVTTGPFWIAERRNERVGFVAGALVTHPYNPDVRLLAEMFWYVDPKHRFGGSVATRLIDVFTEYGRKHADMVTFGAIVGRTRVTDRSLARYGYHPHELSYLLEIGR